jgi:hypothetical protein
VYVERNTPSVCTSRVARRCSCWTPLAFRHLLVTSVAHGESVFTIRPFGFLWGNYQQWQCMFRRGRQTRYMLGFREHIHMEHQARETGTAAFATPISICNCSAVVWQVTVMQPASASSSSGAASDVAEVTYIAKAPSGTQLAAGYSNGTVSVYFTCPMPLLHAAPASIPCHALSSDCSS